MSKQNEKGKIVKVFSVLESGLILPNEPIRCPKCSIMGMTIEIAPPHKTPYGDETIPGFKVDFVCDNAACGYHMSGNLYEP